MAKVVFSVRPDLLKWACNHGEFLSADNPHEVDANAAFAGQIASAAAQGSLIDVSGAPENAVQSDEDSMKVQEKAQADGVWQEGQAMQHELDEAAKAAALAAEADAPVSEEE